MRQTIVRLLFILSGLFLLTANTYAEPLNALFRNSGDPIAGNPKGTITVVEFFDYQCGHCTVMAPVIANIIRTNPEVRVVFKELPVRGALSLVAAKAALAANKQGRYYAFNHALLTSHDYLSEESIYQTAKQLGLNIQRLKKDMNSASVANQIKNTLRLADDLGINGTPAFFIGKTNATNSRDVEYVMGEMSRSELQQAINRLKT
jgi:protein-disulfide isomerase